MKITSIDIIGYGKWSNAHFDCRADFQVFFGENEAGKSTIMAFIHSVLFGFPTKQQTIPRMEPKNGGPYGGRLTLEDTPLGKVIIERLKGKATGDVRIHLEDGQMVGEDKLTDIIGEIDRTTFEAIFSFDIHGLQNIHQWKKKEFERYLLATGTTGSDTLLKTAETLQKKLDALFKPNGRNPAINQQLKKVKESQQAFQEAKKQNTKYEALLAEKEQEIERQSKLQEEKTKIRVELDTLNILLDLWPLYTEWKTLDEKASSSVQTTFPPDGIIRLEHLQLREKEWQNQFIQLEERQKNLINKNDFEQLVFFASNEAEVAYLVESFGAYSERELQQNSLKQEIAYHQTNTEPTKIKWRAELDERIHKLKEQEKINKQRQHDLNLKLTLTSESEQKLQTKIDHIEAEMWDNKTFQLQKDQMERKQKSPTTGLFISLGILVIALLVMIFSLSIWSIAFVLVDVVILGYFLYINQQNGQPKNEQIVAFLEQKKIRQEWQQLLSEMDVVAGEVAELEEDEQKLSKTIYQHDIELRQLYQELGLDDEPQENWELVVLTYKENTQKNQLIVELHQKLHPLEQKQAAYQAKLENLTIPAEYSQIEEKIAFLRQGLLQYRNHLAENAKHTEKVEQVTMQLDLLKQDLLLVEKEKSDLLLQAKVYTEEAFRSKAVQAKEEQKWRERLVLLEAQLEKEKRHELNKFTSQTTIKEKEIQLAEKLHKMELEQERLHASLASKNHEIATLEEGGTFSVLMQKYYSEKSKLQQFVEEWTETKLALEILQEAMQRLQEGKLPKTLALASEYFHDLTGGNYSKVYLHENRLQVESKQVVLFYPEELSQATKEQLYLAIRFALIDVMHKEFPLPIIIDDGFVHFDAARMSQMMQLLKKRKSQNQVIFFTCHRETRKYFSSEDIRML
ncbi:AAA family ATPase [Listeria sp. FSL L7-1509]|uniref:AAA family ATPase n=1 Tax=Listeria immobilis TaxID=2713502 RepID=A0ABR6SVQ5_9LIST|nr:AAA family ATPase [Listeria immobilis]MBC1483110.1 AAA family ATPase [Listeria immobilis]MBC1507090.1 AAA family ATPase [Listeria immobilis]MBC1509550.1 AAA family ATPase [Listeria immobilis]MBC6302387.1 AAA family ATPase [Listeria immobilis]MBC6311912.1 AAA family ATPase [Listeria immobilis]